MPAKNHYDMRYISVIAAENIRKLILHANQDFALLVPRKEPSNDYKNYFLDDLNNYITFISYLQYRKNSVNFFEKNRDKSSLQILSDASNITIKQFFAHHFKCLPWRVSVIHTFWSQLNRNSHIHILITAWWLITNNKTNKRRSIHQDYLSYHHLKAIRKYHLTTLMREYGKQHFNEWTYKKFNKIITVVNQSKSRYIYSDKKVTDTVKVVWYMGRYLTRPVIGESRIISYSQEEWVTFSYYDKFTHTTKQTTQTSSEFFKNLLRHIPEKHFKNVRYGWLFANRVKKDNLNLLKHVCPWSKKIIMKMVTYRTLMIQTLGKDPLRCSCWWEYVFIWFVFDTS